MNKKTERKTNHSRTMLHSVKKASLLILGNVLVFLLLLVCIEFSARLLWTLRSCFVAQTCNPVKLTHLKVRDSDTFLQGNLGITKLHDILGYTLAPDFNVTLNSHGWHNKSLSITSEAFRANDNAYEGTKSILAVGDSFTFGSEVSNSETWPACLERSLERGVANAGVFGYGAAQAVLRAKIESESNTFTDVMLGVLLSDDFKRDRFHYRGGFPRPAVIKTPNGLMWAPPPPAAVAGTRYGKKKESLKLMFLQVLDEYSLIAGIILRNSFPFLDVTGYMLTEKHPDAASEREIVEFTLDQFMELPAKNRYIILHYSEPDIDREDEELMSTRRFVKEQAQERGIHFIDTFEKLKVEFQTKPVGKVWSGHYTAYGNEVVCGLILEALASIEDG